MVVTLTQTEQEELRIAIAEEMGVSICLHCNHEINKDICCCGDSINHYPDGHSPIPMGCQCGYDDAPDRKLKSPSCPAYTTSLDAIQAACLERFKEDDKYHFDINLLAPTNFDSIECVFQLTALDWCIAFARTAKIWRFK